MDTEKNVGNIIGKSWNLFLISIKKYTKFTYSDFFFFYFFQT